MLLSWRICNLILKVDNKLSTTLTRGEHPVFTPWLPTSGLRLAFASRSAAMGPLLHVPGKQVSGKRGLDTREGSSVAAF